MEHIGLQYTMIDTDTDLTRTCFGTSHLFLSCFRFDNRGEPWIVRVSRVKVGDARIIRQWMVGVYQL